ncbi:restriction endonuclease subunit S [Enterococcus lactis]|uniref:restriction endonuclease subunit S n=1 Tax=Enterococcus lactis TaxID=357441 RepID=UPI001CBF71F2|nr:restriction endonuclease subunit S [Enterococcus lactis]UAM74956.1 restriction endonuclease subunit S [Enterococcus lactis]
MSNDAQPEIRFPGFTEDWEERKLGTLLKYEQPTKYIVKSTDYNEGFEIPVLTAGKSFILGYTNEVDGIKNASKDSPIIIFDDFTTSSHYVDFPFKVKSSAMKLLDLTTDSLDFYFIFNILKNIKYVPQSHERHWIAKFSEFKVLVPSYDEQQKIGTFFQQLDDTIALHQRKLDLLKETKKGFLQKMFPKNGAKVPEIRFPGFTEDWEERKLGELTESFDGKRVPIDSDLRISGKYPYYGATGIIDYVDDYIFNGEYVLLAEDGANIIMRNYPVAYLTQGKFWLNNHAHIMRMRNGSNYFLVQVLEKIDYKKYNTGTAQPKLNSKIVKNIELKIPHIEEQQQIGNFFKQLDDIIALHQRKLDLLKETKKGFLQKMFV